MKKKIIILILVMSASFSMNAQYGGVINALNNSGVLGQIRRNVSSLMTSDSIAALKLDSLKSHLPIANGKLSIDSIVIKSMPSVTATNPSVSSTGSAVPSSATMVGGTDGTNLRAIKTTSGGLIQLDSSMERSTLKISSGAITATLDSATQRSTVKVSQLPLLPAFAATPTFNIGTGGYAVSAADSTKYRISMKIQESALPVGASTETTLSGLNTKIPSGLTVTSTRLLVDPSGVTSPVSLASVPSHAVTNAGTFAVQVDSSLQRSTVKVSQLPSIPSGSNTIGSINNVSGVISLPTGAATESSLANIFGAIGTTNTTLSTINGKIPSNLTVSSTRLLVDPSGVTSPISASSLPLPTGAATSALQTTGNTSLTDIKDNQTNGSQVTNIYDINTSGYATVINNAGTNPLAVQQTNSTGVPIDLAQSTQENDALLKGYLSYGYDRALDRTHPIATKTDPDMADNEWGLPTMAYDQDNAYYGMLKMENNFLKTTSRQANVSGGTATEGYEIYGLVNTDAHAPYTDGKIAAPSLNQYGAVRVMLTDETGNYVDATSGGGGGGGGISSFTTYDTCGSSTNFTVTNLNSLANSATVGWQSDSVRNTFRKALDYRVMVSLTMSNTTPANDKTVYVYVAPFYYDGSSYQGPSLGTTSQATGVQGACTIASGAPNNLSLLGTLAYSTQNMVLRSTFTLSSVFGRGAMPDAFSIVVIDYSGSNVASSGNIVAYKPIYQTNR